MLSIMQQLLTDDVVTGAKQRVAVFRIFYHIIFLRFGSVQFTQDSETLRTATIM